MGARAHGIGPGLAKAAAGAARSSHARPKSRSSQKRRRGGGRSRPAIRLMKELAICGCMIEYPVGERGCHV